ncbi:hypothetical protein SVIOM74S_03068 [Streptomyces violarus]
MQDTSDLQQRLLDKVFGPPGTVVQRVGDINQRIFADAPDAAQPSSFPLPHAAQLPVSRRFGSKIAALASDLTVHRRQRIDGAGHDGTVALLLFDDDTVAEVVPAFERMAAAAVPRQLLLDNPPRVLGARLTREAPRPFHNPSPATYPASPAHRSRQPAVSSRRHAPPRPSGNPATTTQRSHSCGTQSVT